MKEALLAIGVKGLGAVFSFVTIATFPMYLNPEVSAVLSALWAVLILSGVICTFGANVSLYDDLDSVRHRYLPAMVSSVLVSSLVACLTWYFDFIRGVNLWLILLIVILYSVSEVVVYILRVERRMMLSLWPRELIWRGLVLSLGTGILILYPLAVNLYILSISFFLLLVVCFQIYTIWGNGLNLNLASFLANFRLSRFPFLISLFSVLNSQLMIVLLFSIVSDEIASRYFLIERVSNLILFFLTSVASYYNAKVALSFGTGKQYFISQAALVSALPVSFSLVVFCIYYMSGCVHLEAVCSADFSMVVFWLFSAQAVNAMTGISGFMVQNLGGAGSYLFFSSFCSIFLFALQIHFALSGEIGIVSFLSFLLSLLTNVYAVLYVHFRGGYRTDVFYGCWYFLRRCDVRR